MKHTHKYWWVFKWSSLKVQLLAGDLSFAYYSVDCSENRWEHSKHLLCPSLEGWILSSKLPPGWCNASYPTVGKSRKTHTDLLGVMYTYLNKTTSKNMLYVYIYLYLHQHQKNQETNIGPTANMVENFPNPKVLQCCGRGAGCNKTNLPWDLLFEENDMIFLLVRFMILMS